MRGDLGDLGDLDGGLNIQLPHPSPALPNLTTVSGLINAASAKISKLFKSILRSGLSSAAPVHLLPSAKWDFNWPHNVTLSQCDSSSLKASPIRFTTHRTWHQ